MRLVRAVAAVCVAALVGACAEPATTDWGPMAVVEDNSTILLGVAGQQGTVRITGACVIFAVDGGTDQRTLAWRSDHATWDDLFGQVVFDLPYADPVRISDGDRLKVGGARPSTERWLKTPSPDCPPDVLVVYEVSPAR